MARQKRDDTSVKISAAVARKARVIAAYRNITMAEYLTEVLGKPVDKDYEALRRLMAKGDEPEHD